MMERSPWLAQLNWVRRHTPLTRGALAKIKPLKQSRVTLSFHLDLKMIPVLEALSDTVELAVFSCNPKTSDPQGEEFLRKHPNIEFYDTPPPPVSHPNHFLCDLGGELICSYLSASVLPKAALEGTTSGISRICQTLANEEPRFPIFDWNDAPLKREIHNEKMVGSSLWQTFSEVTRLSLHGFRVAVLGFGPVGRGIAREARQRGACVAVYDPDSRAQTLAAFEGFEAKERSSLLAWAGIVVSATGVPDAVLASDLEAFQDGAFLVNAGHSSKEIEVAIRQAPRTEVLEHVEEIGTDNGSLFLLGGGQMFNLGAGFGDSINGFDLTSAQLVAALGHVLAVGAQSPPGWHSLPSDFF